MESIRVADYMKTQAVYFTVEMTVAEAAEKMIKSHQIGGPVIDATKKVIGFLSEQDCLTHFLEDTYLSDPHSTVKELMRTEVLTVSINDSIINLAEQMSAKKPKLYPVVDESNLLLGIITRNDLLRAISVHLRSFYEKGHGRMV